MSGKLAEFREENEDTCKIRMVKWRRIKGQQGPRRDPSDRVAAGMEKGRGPYGWNRKANGANGVSDIATEIIIMFEPLSVAVMKRIELIHINHMMATTMER